MGKKYIYTCVAVVILLCSNAVFAQTYPEWVNKYLNNPEYFNGVGSCYLKDFESQDGAIECAKVDAIREISRNIYLSYESHGYKSTSREKKITGSNGSKETKEEIEIKSHLQESVSTFLTIHDISLETFEETDKVYALAYVNKKQLANKYVNRIKDDLIGPVEAGLKMMESCLTMGDFKGGFKQGERVESHLKEIKLYQIIARICDDEANIMSEDVSKAYIRLEKYLSEADRMRIKAAIKQQSRINGCAAVASIFVPGAGQWYKGNKFKDNGLIGDGVGFFLGEAALAGGGLTSYFLSKKQLALMRDPNVSYVDFQKAKKNYKACRITTIVAYSAAAALHIGNIFHAGFKSPKEGDGCVQLYPTVISTDTEVVGGVGLTYNF